MAWRVLALAGFLALYAVPALASHANCAPAKDMATALESNFGEAVTGQGVSGSGTIFVQFYLNPDTGTFTVVATDITGISCMVAGGKDWEAVTPEKGPGT